MPWPTQGTEQANPNPAVYGVLPGGPSGPIPARPVDDNPLSLALSQLDAMVAELHVSIGRHSEKIAPFLTQPLSEQRPPQPESNEVRSQMRNWVVSLTSRVEDAVYAIQALTRNVES